MDFTVDRAAPRKVYDILIGLVAPRPIALVTSLNEAGRVDAAPFSAYNYLCSDPPIVALGIGTLPGGAGLLKHTARNIRARGEFVINVVTHDIAQAMNICAIDFPEGTDKLAMAGLEVVPSAKVTVPRLRQAHAALECTEYMTIGIGHGSIVLGQVVSMYVQDEFVDPAGPFVRAETLHAIGRMDGQGTYVRTQDAFMHMPRLTYEAWLAAKHETQHA